MGHSFDFLYNWRKIKKFRKLKVVIFQVKVLYEKNKMLQKNLKQRTFKRKQTKA